jgi:SPX domain-containing protein involved in vacuolar polyphosphate accumulation
MDQYQYIFQRYEMKYLLEEDKYKQLIERLQGRLQTDKFGKTTICNIYFDTPDYRLIRTSLDKPVYKEKLRLRSYGAPKGSDTVFVEIKKKYKGIVYKRRETMKLAQAEAYLYQGEPSGKTTQITKEIDWFIKSYKNLQPAMYISYDRIAMYGIEDEELRLTFDSNLLWRDEDLKLQSGIWGNPIMEPGQRLMEIKIPGTMPLWMAHLLNEFEIYPVSFSKYGRGYSLAVQQKKNKNLKGEKKYA